MLNDQSSSSHSPFIVLIQPFHSSRNSSCSQPYLAVYFCSLRTFQIFVKVFKSSNFPSVGFSTRCYGKHFSVYLGMMGPRQAGSEQPGFVCLLDVDCSRPLTRGSVGLSALAECDSFAYTVTVLPRYFALRAHIIEA